MSRLLGAAGLLACPAAVTTSSEPEDGGPRFEGRIGLRDGRGIGFAEYGVATGRTMFWFHGTPGGRHQVPPAARRFAAANDVRLIALERPGVGGSTPHLYDSLVDWADDVTEVAEQLGVGRFGLIGFSGGGPYALACAHRMPERVVAAAVMGCVAPTCGSEATAGGTVGLSRRLSPLLEVVREPLGYALWALVRTLTPLSSQGFDAFIRIMPEGDQVVFRHPEIKRMFIDDLAQAAAPGSMRRSTTSSSSLGRGASRCATSVCRSASGTARPTTSSHSPTPSSCFNWCLPPSSACVRARDTSAISGPRRRSSPASSPCGPRPSVSAADA